MPDPAALREFLAWGARQRDFPYSELSWWAEAFLRKDGLDMYGRKITPAISPGGDPRESTTENFSHPRLMTEKEKHMPQSPVPAPQPRNVPRPVQPRGGAAGPRGNSFANGPAGPPDAVSRGLYGEARGQWEGVA